MEESALLLGIVGIIVSATAAGIGFRVGRRESKKQLELFLKALNIERQIKDLDEPRLFLEDDTVKGEGKFSMTVTSKLTIIDMKNKKIIGEGGARDMTLEEIEKYGKKSPA